MGRGESVGGQRATAPEAESTRDAGKEPWLHEAPTRPNARAALTTEENDPHSAATSKIADEPTPEPVSSPVATRLSDRWRWFESTPPPVSAIPRSAPLVEEPPAPKRNQGVGAFVVTLSMGLCLLILFAATIVRVRAAFSDDRPRALSSTPASSPVMAAAEDRASESATDVAPPADPSPSTGELRLGATAVGHRITVDGRLIRDPSSSLRLPCGEHTVRIGYAGKARAAVVPCGGSVTLAP